MIDWNKPIETVPCERNPEPVPCVVVEKDELLIKILGSWIDDDGLDEGFRRVWSVCKSKGQFLSLAGSVRNVVEPTIVNIDIEAAEALDFVTGYGFATLRDEFAMATLSGASLTSHTPRSIAARAYAIADALLAEREKSP